jgi:hypothetical protein
MTPAGSVRHAKSPERLVDSVVIATDVPLGWAADTLPDAASFVPVQRKALEAITKKAIGSKGVPFKIRVEVGNPAQSITIRVPPKRKRR